MRCIEETGWGAHQQEPHVGLAAGDQPPVGVRLDAVRLQVLRRRGRQASDAPPGRVAGAARRLGIAAHPVCEVLCEHGAGLGEADVVDL
jgi:hypothetical protein